MRTMRSESVLKIQFELTLDPVEIIFRHRKALGVDLPQGGAEVSHQLPIVVLSRIIQLYYMVFVFVFQKPKNSVFIIQHIFKT